MLKMAVYLEANAILGSSLSPKNYCICKITALNNGADPAKIQAIVANAANNRLLPVSALQRQVTTYSIVFKDWDGTVISTQSVVQGGFIIKPADPTREGYTFAGWSPALSHIATSNVTYTATYTENSYYTIIFADGKKSKPGIYFYMNDGSIKSVSDTSNINKNDVIGVAYVAANGGFLIDSKDSEAILFGKPADGFNYSECTSTRGEPNTQKLKAGQNASSPMPIVEWCNSRFDGEGFIPGLSELQLILNRVEEINQALEFIGHLPLKLNPKRHAYGENIYFNEDVQSLLYKYWTSSYNDDGYLNYPNYAKEVIVCAAIPFDVERKVFNNDPDNPGYSTQTVTEIITPSGHINHQNYTAYVRILKHIDVAAPQVAVQPIYSTQQVESGVTPTKPADPTYEGYTFTGWSPALYPANKDEIYVAQWTENSSGGGSDDPGDKGIYAFDDYTQQWVSSGNTVALINGKTSVDVKWVGYDEPSGNWRFVANGPENTQGASTSWGTGYFNNITPGEIGCAVYGAGETIQGRWTAYIRNTN